MFYCTKSKDDSALIVAVTVYYESSVTSERLQDDINTRVFKALAENDIEIPYNYTSVVIKQEGGVSTFGYRSSAGTICFLLLFGHIFVFAQTEENTTAAGNLVRLTDEITHLLFIDQFSKKSIANPG